MKTIRTQQIVKALILLKRRGVSTADRVYIAFKLKQITLDKQYDLKGHWTVKLYARIAERLSVLTMI